MGLPKDEENTAEAPVAPQTSPEAPVDATLGDQPQAAPVQPTPEASAPMPDQSGVSPSNMGQGQPPVPEKTTAQIAQEMNDHDLALQRDLAMGAIKPKSYADLVGPGLMGRIGTFFGLLVSGAGAGLTHQPNALLGMMDKEIERDIDRQKTEKTNAQNWYKLHFEHQAQQAAAMAAAASGYANTTTGDLNVLRMKDLNPKDLDLSATNAAKNSIFLLSIQDQQDAINQMPPGPLREARQRVLDQTVKPAALFQIQQNNETTANKLGTAKALRKAAQPDPFTIDRSKIEALKTQSRKSGSLNNAQQFDNSDYSQALDDAKHLENNRQAAKIYVDVTKKLVNRPLGGALNQRDYDALTQQAKAKIDTLLGGSSKIDIENMFPSWKDLGGNIGRARQDKFESMMELFKKNEVTKILDAHPDIKGKFPEFESPFPKEKGKTVPKEKEEPDVRKYADTHKITYEKAAEIKQKREGRKAK
jgi:hypothetical protein